MMLMRMMIRQPGSQPARQARGQTSETGPGRGKKRKSAEARITSQLPSPVAPPRLAGVC